MLKNLRPEERHKTVYIVSSDTLVENPLIKIYLDNMLQLLREAAKRDHLPLSVNKQEAETRRTRTLVLLEQDQEKLAQLEEKLAELSQLDKEGALCQKKLENTIALEKVFSEYRNRLLEEKRASVEKYATEVFSQQMGKNACPAL